MVPNKLKEILGSSDIELVQLGATVIEQMEPQEKWDDILLEYLSLEFDWKIKDGSIKIYRKTYSAQFERHPYAYHDPEVIKHLIIKEYNR